METEQIEEAIATARAADADITGQQLVDLLNELDSEAYYTLGDDDYCNPIITTGDIVYADDGNCEVAFPCYSHREAAESYVRDGDWGDSDATEWISVATCRKGFSLDGEEIVYDQKQHKVAIEPVEPACLAGKAHDWRSPFSVFGGLEENPGVFGHGGGAIRYECCAHCGKRRTVDSWAQDLSDGEQGLDSVTYLGADDDTLAYVRRRLIEAISEKFDGLDAIKSYTPDDGEITAVIAEDIDFGLACDDIEGQLDDDQLIYWRDEDARTLEITISI